MVYAERKSFFLHEPLGYLWKLSKISFHADNAVKTGFLEASFILDRYF